MAAVGARALVLLAATTVPASAAVSNYWADLNGQSVYAAAEVNTTATQVNCVPRYSDARRGYTAACLNLGVTLSFPNGSLSM